MRGQSLAVRLAVLLSAVVVVVLVLAGVVVNRAASRSLEDTLGPRDEQRLGLAVAFIDEALERGVGGRGLDAMVRRVATESRGVARVIDADGTLLASSGRLPLNVETQAMSHPLTGGGTLEVVVPNPRAPFLGAFNTALLLTGTVAVGALLLAAAGVASRVTRPLREVAEAARRLGRGDLGARARGGADSESAELAAAFNTMAARLERSEELRRRAASDLAHDLATPATVLESQLQAMVDGVVAADAEQLERARLAATGLSGVITQLGELTRAEAAPLQRRAERVSLGELSREVVDGSEGLLRERGVTAFVAGEAWATADRGQLARALRNVVINAIQHSPRDGEVRVEVAEGALRVIDQGPGIPADDLPFIFERFYRADRARSTGVAGSGIGLTVAGELIAANGGSLEVESTGPEGTVFRITLPV